MDKETGGRAFPWCGDLNETPTIELGMTMRDYLAAKAMQAMISNPSMMDNASDGVVNYVTSASYKFADAMLAARAISKATGE